MMADRVKGDTSMAANPGLQNHNGDIPTYDSYELR